MQKKNSKWKKTCEAETPSSILFYTRIDNRVKFVWSLKQCVAVGSIHVENWIIWKQKGLGKRGGRSYNRVIENKRWNILYIGTREGERENEWERVTNLERVKKRMCMCVCDGGEWREEGFVKAVINCDSIIN